MDRELISAKEVSKRFGIPEYAVYRMVKDGRLPAHEMSRQPWHKRRRLGFVVEEVAAALGISSH